MIAVCAALSVGGAAAVFAGPMSSTSSAHLSSLCAAVGLPHFEARNDAPLHPTSPSHRDSINVFPHHAQISRALFDFVTAHQWTSVILLYTNDDGKFTVDRKTGLILLCGPPP